jgi:hypothetical protein
MPECRLNCIPIQLQHTLDPDFVEGQFPTDHPFFRDAIVTSWPIHTGRLGQNQLKGNWPSRRVILGYFRTLLT